jgi:hypothetical protein
MVGHFQVFFDDAALYGFDFQDFALTTSFNDLLRLQ